MDDLLTAVSTISYRPKPESEQTIIQEISSTEQKPKSKPRSIFVTPTSAHEVLQILRSSPGEDTLIELLDLLSQGSQKVAGFDIRNPSPSSAKVINEIIITTIPDFWGSSDGSNSQILRCLRSVAAVGAVVARLRLLTSQYQSDKQGVKTSDTARPLVDLITVLSQLLNSDDISQSIFADINRLVDNQSKRTLLWKEFITSAASGKIIAVVAEAEDKTKESRDLNTTSWLSDGSKYSAWLGRNVCTMMREATTNTTTWKAIAQLCGKGFSIGYPTKIVEELHSQMSFSGTDSTALITTLLRNLQIHEQKQVLDATMKIMARRCVSLQATPDYEDDSSKTPLDVSAAAGLIAGLIGGNETMNGHLAAWLSDPAMNSSESVGLRRAAVAAFVRESHGSTNMLKDPVQDLMEKSMKLFGQNLFIKHAPILQQEACAQVLLLTAGYLHRTQPMSLFILARSSIHLNGMSNRLNASSPRARSLGMAVAMAISDLVDKPGSKMNFDIDDVKTPESHWYQRLVKINDVPGGHSEIRRAFQSKEDLRQQTPKPTRKTQAVKKPTPPKPELPVQTEIQGPRVVEVLDDSEDDDDLVPYAKPDSDAEDEDEDPTLINRDKPKAPVYIRDLIAGLHDTENYDRHRLALQTAASLIRRKTSFGKEVSDHAIEIAAILVGLGDPFELENFIELRLQALIAILISDPKRMAPWFARQVFDGDYSLSQRATILSVLGLSARELAGFKSEDEDLNPSNPTTTSFPSKKLPPHLHKIYAAAEKQTQQQQQQEAPVSRIASRLEKGILQPLALNAADKLSGPNALKIRTFSSRMDVEKKKSNRKKLIPNNLAKILAESFFFPLTGHWHQHFVAYGGTNNNTPSSSSPSNIHFHPLLLSTFLKTLALMLHASGPGTTSLQQMTAEFWDILLGVRTAAVGDVVVLEATLFGFLVLLEVYEGDGGVLAERFGRVLVETGEWVRGVFEGVGGGGGRGGGGREGNEDLEGRVGMLAAGILVRTGEVIEKYERLLVGDIGY